MIDLFIYSTSVCMPFLGNGGRALNKARQAPHEAYILWGFWNPTANDKEGSSRQCSGRGRK